jgi:hypothetical protein
VKHGTESRSQRPESRSDCPLSLGRGDLSLAPLSRRRGRSNDQPRPYRFDAIGERHANPLGPAGAAHALMSGDIVVTVWRDPVVEAHGWPTVADDTLVWLAGVVGPSGTLVGHRLAAYAADGDSTSAPDVLAATFGLDAGGRNSSLVRTLARLEQFGIIRITTRTIAVRLAVGPSPNGGSPTPPLPRRRLPSLPRRRPEQPSGRDAMTGDRRLRLNPDLGTIRSPRLG